MRCLHEVEAEVGLRPNERPQLFLSSTRNRRGDGVSGASLPDRYPYTSFTPHTPEHVFSLKGSERSPAFLPLLLILSGDIETNPGPPPKNTLYPCPTCAEPYSRRKGAIPCPGCKSWTFYTKKCSWVKQNYSITSDFLDLRLPTDAAHQLIAVRC